MDLIYTNHDREDIGVLLDYDLDLAFGKDENDFVLTMSANDHCMKTGYYIYMDGTDYGGIVDSVKSDSSKEEVTYSGRTWQGVLNSKILAPDSGQDYLTVSGEANSVIGSLLARCGLSALFQASTTDSGITIKSYQMNRYISAYDGIIKMLKTVGGKLYMEYSNGSVMVSAVKAVDYSNDEEFDSDLVQLQIEKTGNTCNHLICLGKGDLKERTVIHLYADSKGNISDKQTFTGLEEYAETYDYGNAESDDDLRSKGMEKLKELLAKDTIKVDLDSSDTRFDVGDIVGAYDSITDMQVSAEVSKKIVNVSNGNITITYEVGD